VATSDDNSASASSERENVDAYLGGDAEGFRALYRRHASRLLRLGLSSGLDRATAEDIVQSTFLRFHESRQRLDRGRPVAPWLVTIALNLIRDRGRKSARQLGAEEELRTHAARRAAEDPHSLIEGHQVAVRAQRALAALPTAQREAVLAVRVGGLSYASAAEALSTSEAAVRQNVHRGLRRMMEALKSGDEARDLEKIESGVRRSS